MSISYEFPYFRVTSYSANYDSVLKSWLRHFENLGIPACVEFNKLSRHNGQGMLYGDLGKKHRQ